MRRTLWVSVALIAGCACHASGTPILGSTQFGKQLLAALGKDSAAVQGNFGKGQAQTLTEFEYLKDFGATSAVFYYGKNAMPDDYLKGLTFAASMTCFFGKDGCFIGISGVGDGSVRGVLSVLETELGLSKGSLKVGKTLLSGKATVREINGGPVKVYATSWGAKAKTTIGALWLSKFGRPAKLMTSSF